MSDMEQVRREAQEAVNEKHPWWHDQGVGIAQGSHYRAGFVDGAAWQAERADAAEAKLAAIRDALSDAPECDLYDGDDAISCGWKIDMQTVRAILTGGDS